jgi:hypothetical protein
MIASTSSVSWTSRATSSGACRDAAVGREAGAAAVGEGQAAVGAAGGDAVGPRGDEGLGEVAAGGARGRAEDTPGAVGEVGGGGAELVERAGEPRAPRGAGAANGLQQVVEVGVGGDGRGGPRERQALFEQGGGQRGVVEAAQAVADLEEPPQARVGRELAEPTADVGEAAAVDRAEAGE